MISRTIATFCVIAPLMATGCVTQGMGQKQGFGTIGGAAVGGLAGSQFGDGRGRLITTGIGTLLGAFLGNEIGASLDRADHAYLQDATYQAYTAPIGRQIQWSNPQSGNYGWVQPVRDGYATTGGYCREYQSTIIVGGRKQQGHGTACRQPDGSWQIANN